MSAGGRALIPPDDGEAVALGGLGVVFKLSGAETGGVFADVEHPLQPGALAGPPHTHANEDEVSLVLAGEVGVLIGDEVFRATPGTYVVKPRAVPHTLGTAGSEPARVQEIIAPAGFEEYFREVATVLSAGGPPDLAEIAEIAARYGLTLHPERLPEIMREHNVRLQ